MFYYINCKNSLHKKFLKNFPKKFIFLQKYYFSSYLDYFYSKILKKLKLLEKFEKNYLANFYDLLSKQNLLCKKILLIKKLHMTIFELLKIKFLKFNDI